MSENVENNVESVETPAEQPKAPAQGPNLAELVNRLNSLQAQNKELLAKQEAAEQSKLEKKQDYEKLSQLYKEHALRAS